MTPLSEKIASLPPAHRELFERLRALQESETVTSIEPIAVVGMGCRFPGDVHDPASFWDLLTGARDAVTEVPAGRWERDAWYLTAADTPGEIATRQGAFLNGIDRFDAEFFGISPREAGYLDPQHRLLLEVTWDALETAGCAPDALQATSTRVFVGARGWAPGVSKSASERMHRCPRGRSQPHGRPRARSQCDQSPDAFCRRALQDIRRRRRWFRTGRRVGRRRAEGLGRR